MKRSQRLFALVGLAAVAAAQAPGQAAGQTTAQTGGQTTAQTGGGLKLTPKEGGERKYKLKMVLDLNGSPGQVTFDLVEKVLKVDPSGLVSIQAKQSDLVVSIGGQDINGDAGASRVYVLRPDGTMSEIRGEGVESNDYRLAVLDTVKLPDTPMAADAQWTWTAPADAKKGTVKVSATYKVTGQETIAGIDAWKIDFSVKELEGEAPASSTGTVWISKADASLVKRVAKEVNLPVAGAPAPVNGDETLVLSP